MRLVTYNIRHCRGTDGRVAPERIAAVIAGTGADVVALQEVDLGRARTGGADQAGIIAAALGMTAHFHAALEVGAERYGIAILTRHASRVIRAGALPGLASRRGLEPRGAIWVEVARGAERLQVINTHLGLVPAERHAQVAALLGPDWLGAARCRAPYVLVGDFNATPWSRAYRRIAAHLRDARRAAGIRRGPTFPSLCPVLPLDHVFLGPGLAARGAAIVRGTAARRASDHLPLLVDLDRADAIAEADAQPGRAGARSD